MRVCLNHAGSWFIVVATRPSSLMMIFQGFRPQLHTVPIVGVLLSQVTIVLVGILVVIVRIRIS